MENVLLMPGVRGQNGGNALKQILVIGHFIRYPAEVRSAVQWGLGMSVGIFSSRDPLK